MKTEVELLSCPFCGGVAHLIEHVGHEHSDTLVRLTGIPKQAAPNWTVECQSCPCGLIDDDRDSVIAAWNRRPASPSIGRVVVKALEWDGTVAANPFGAYTVTQTGDDDHWSYVWHEYPYGEYTGAFATEDEAKAAAQADYEQRILSALSTGAHQ